MTSRQHRIVRVHRFDDDEESISLILASWITSYDTLSPNYVEELAEDPSPAELGDLLDNMAENENYHALVGVGEVLAALLTREAGQEVAARVLTFLAVHGWPDNLRNVDVVVDGG